jgi:hypothetical protein
LDLFGGSGDPEGRDGTGSLFATVASIIDELTSSDDRAIRAAETTPFTCPGPACGASTAAGTAFLLVLISLATAIAEVLVIRAISRR